MKIKTKKQPLGLDKPQKARKTKQLPHFSPSLQKLFGHSIDCVILNDSIRLKGKQIISTTGFSTKVNRIPIMGLPIHLKSFEHAFGTVEADDVKFVINIKPKKFERLLELFKQQKRISFEMVAKSANIISTGFLKEISYAEDSTSFTYSPNEFTIL